MILISSKAEFNKFNRMVDPPEPERDGDGDVDDDEEALQAAFPGLNAKIEEK